MADTLQTFFQNLVGHAIVHKAKSYTVDKAHDDYVTLHDPHPAGALDGQSASLHVPYAAVAGIDDTTLKGQRSVTLHTMSRWT